MDKEWIKISVWSCGVTCAIYTQQGLKRNKFQFLYSRSGVDSHKGEKALSFLAKDFMYINFGNIL